MSHWGVPDWTDSAAYPQPDELTTREWWWQFTRRRPDYRNLWKQAQPLEGETHRYAHDVDEFRLRFELSVIHDPHLSLSDWSLMQFRYARNFARSPRERLLEQAGHPSANQTFAVATHRGKLADEAGHMLYNFDLSRPLAPQLARAQSWLESVQHELFGKIGTRRPRLANWRDFLRALDGRDSGASFASMAMHLWPGQQKTPQSARDTYEAACDLRDNFPI